MRVWGCNQPCLLCREPDETHDHLFFACPYSFTVWLDVLGDLFGMDANSDWTETLDRLSTHSFERDIFLL